MQSKSWGIRNCIKIIRYILLKLVYNISNFNLTISTVILCTIGCSIFNMSIWLIGCIVRFLLGLTFYPNIDFKYKTVSSEKRNRKQIGFRRIPQRHFPLSTRKYYFFLVVGKLRTFLHFISYLTFLDITQNINYYLQLEGCSTQLCTASIYNYNFQFIIFILTRIYVDYPWAHNLLAQSSSSRRNWVKIACHISIIVRLG